MKRINYKSDFDFILQLKDSSGKDMGWPGFDWRALLYTKSKHDGYEASCIGGKCVNCFNDNGQIHIVADCHNLGIGALKVDLFASLPDKTFADGWRDVCLPRELGIELVPGSGEDAPEMGAVIVLPFVSEDADSQAFTPEEIDELIENIGDKYTPAGDGEESPE
ncbi:MAG: hypothetical protein NC204_05770 [Candidatus Amulumruptor caecigallinarius]|nr:hypothetical protein [Candidatus Amulumruptor caecigallinarius]